MSTKYRHPIISTELWDYLYGKLTEITQYYPKLFIKEANHDKDHIHLLISIPPQMTVGATVRLLKTNTSRNIKTKFPILKKHYWGSDGIWSDGYFVSTVGINARIIAKYIQKQGDLDTGQRASLFD
jgi:putative transposase